ncbi:MAG: hypothetical protein U0451_00620 [Candidatus Saccharimonadales bacterium]
MNSEINRPEDELSVSSLSRAAKIVGATLLGGLGGYMVSRGIEQYIVEDIGATEIFESVVTLGGVVLSGFITSETTQ